MKNKSKQPKYNYKGSYIKSLNKQLDNLKELSLKHRGRVNIYQENKFFVDNQNTQSAIVDTKFGKKLIVFVSEEEYKNIKGVKSAFKTKFSHNIFNNKKSVVYTTIKPSVIKVDNLTTNANIQQLIGFHSTLEAKDKSIKQQIRNLRHDIKEEIKSLKEKPNKLKIFKGDNNFMDTNIKRVKGLLNPYNEFNNFSKNIIKAMKKEHYNVKDINRLSKEFRDEFNKTKTVNYLLSYGIDVTTVYENLDQNQQARITSILDNYFKNIY